MPGEGILRGVLRALVGSGERAAGRGAAEGALRQAAEREAPLAVARRQAPLAVERMPAGWERVQQQKALPPPPRRLALPAPPPGGTYAPNTARPKPRGGQWWPDKAINSANWSPELAARHARPTGVTFSGDPRDVALKEWWDRALTKYLKNDFATESDPLLGLAERGLHHVEGISPQEWRDRIETGLTEDSVGGIMFPHNPLGGMPGAGDDLRGGVLASMPWVGKMPVTDSIFGIDPANNLEFRRVADELRNALNPEVHGFPSDLAVRPESLSRMSFPQAVEHVGKINQWRAQQLADQSLAAFDNPAIHVVKEYPESQHGMRWVELKQPDDAGSLPTGYSLKVNPQGHTYLVDAEGNTVRTAYASEADAIAGAHRRLLQDALRFEGDTMGHCVGGYCDDVTSGRSRIFSLRDSRGMPHVTIETAPGAKNRTRNDIPTAEADRLAAQATADLNRQIAEYNLPVREGSPKWTRTWNQSLDLLQREWLRNNPAPASIVQIKGKQNRAPIEDYLPYVQDFVKTQGPWGRVGELANTRLTQLPDGRFINESQWNEGISKYLRERNPQWTEDWLQDRIASNYAPEYAHDVTGMIAGNWDQFKPYFEGYAYGGRVEPHRDFARHPFAVSYDHA